MPSDKCSFLIKEFRPLLTAGTELQCCPVLCMKNCMKCNKTI